jgi:3-dehydroquinate synthetase
MARSNGARSRFALFVERQCLGNWMATSVDVSNGRPVRRLNVDTTPGGEVSSDDLCAIAASLASQIGPVASVIFLAEDGGSPRDFEPKLVAGYPLPIWIVHPTAAIASAVPAQHSRIVVVDFSGDGSVLMLKRGAGLELDDLCERRGDLRSLVAPGLHRRVLHSDVLADVIGASEAEPAAAALGSAAPPAIASIYLAQIFADVLRDLEPMLAVLQSFGYDALVCKSAVFASEPDAAAFARAAARIGAGRKFSIIVGAEKVRYKGALDCVGEVRRNPGVWFSGTSERPAFSLVTERRISYEVQHVTRHVFDPDDSTLGALLDDRPTFAVVDRLVADRYGNALSAYAANHVNLVGDVAIDATEAAKSWAFVERICADAIRSGLGRDGVILAVGGGITLDIAGMAASVFRRGIRYVRVPTTLVGMIDVGVGIKQGVNFAAKKNLLGSFYPPFGCINDLSFLQTLPPRHLACGIAEMIKIALICDRRLFELLESNIVELIDSRFQEPLAAADESILRAQLSMMQQLQPNLFEHDLQRWVDFGHTFSPALELASDHALAHGEAVALDMALATAIAVLRRECDISVLERMVRLYRAARLPVTHTLCTGANLAASLHDARLHRGGNLNLVVPTAVGAGAFLQDVDDRDIDSAAGMVAELGPALAGA